MGKCFNSTEKYSDLVCEDVPKSVYLNALADKLPECDRKTAMSTLSDGKHADMCYVYCAQRSCGAAKAYMQNNHKELRHKCSMITYLHNGALSMDPNDLVDGNACHNKITQSNKKKGVKSTCLTCDENDKGSKLPLKINGVVTPSQIVTTKGKVPDWYQRRGIVASLPTQFSCDKRYNPPQPHQPERAASTFEIDISNTELPPDAILGYWASRKSNEIVEASRAYGNFDNSGIVQCRKSICEFKLDHPGMYTTEGKVYKPHVHFTEWKGDRWNMVAKTIEF